MPHWRMYDNGYACATCHNPETGLPKRNWLLLIRNEVLHKGIDLNTLLLNEIDDYLPFDFIKEAEQLRLMPLYELMEKLFKSVSDVLHQTTGCLSVRLL